MCIVIVFEVSKGNVFPAAMTSATSGGMGGVNESVSGGREGGELFSAEEELEEWAE